MTDRSQRVATAAQRVSVILPHPPRTLGKGNSAGWWTVRRDYVNCKIAAYYLLRDALDSAGIIVGEDAPWDGAIMHIDWLFAGTPPDDDNIVTRCAAARDAAEDIGLVTNDRFVTIGTVTTTRVKRISQCVEMAFEKAER
jgi:hypothetical protein